MKKHKYIFIDESGSPTFLGKRGKSLVGTDGYSPLLLIGMVSTNNRVLLREQVVGFQKKILADPLYKSIYSVSQPDWYLHAKNDHSEIRAKFFEYLRRLKGFQVHVIIGRKHLGRFKKRHNSDPTAFYFELLKLLLTRRLSKADIQYNLYLAQRKSSTMERFNQAIIKAIDSVAQDDKVELSYKSDIVKSSMYPELSIVDYLLWALQRYIIFKEERYFKALQHKYNLIIDPFDRKRFEEEKLGNFYWKDNPFSLDVASPFNVDKPK